MAAASMAALLARRLDQAAVHLALLGVRLGEIQAEFLQGTSSGKIVFRRFHHTYTDNSHNTCFQVPPFLLATIWSNVTVCMGVCLVWRKPFFHRCTLRSGASPVSIKYEKRLGDRGKMAISFPVEVQTHQIHLGPSKVVYYPQAVHMQNLYFQQLINERIVMEIQQLINRQAAEMPSQVAEMIGTYELKNNQRDVLSLSLSNYAYHVNAAHGMTYLRSLTFDLQRGQFCTLQDLFLPESDYVMRLSELIHKQMEERSIPILGEFEAIRSDQDFYIADKTLVIYFQLYEITPYVFGFPMFPISVYALQDIIDEKGPLGRMLENR